MVSYILSIPRRLWLFLANLPMERKLIVVFVFVLSLPITYVSYLSSRSTFNSVLQSSTKSAGQMAGNASDTIDRYIADLKRYTALPLYNTDVQFYLEQQNTDWEKNTSMSMFLSYLIHTKEEMTAVYLVDKYGYVFYDRAPGINELFPAERMTQWRSLTEEAGVAPVVQGRHTIRVNSGEHREVFSVMRTVSSVSMLKPIGMIVFDIDIKLFKGIADPVNAVTQGNTIIVDEHGGLVYGGISADSAGTAHTDSPDREQQDIALLLEKTGGPEGHFQIRLEEQDYLAVYTVSQKTGWTTMVTIPLERILTPVQKTRNTLILTTLAIVAIALVVATFISHALTKPLKSLVRLMKQVQHGNLDVWLSPKYNDEIGMIGSHFNRMIIRVKDLIQEVSLTEKRKQKADMRALQNQINPHFIYNTLESIRMLAESSEDPRVAELTYLLGLQMRYGIVRSEEMVTVRHELDHVRNYLNLLHIRFPDKFRLQMDVPEAFLPLPLLKLVFQPVVENAVFHGLEAKEGPGTILITAWSEEGTTVFCVADDGVGMDGDTLRLLNSNLLDSTDSEKFGIGLRNVNERLRLHYGSACGLQVFSEPGRGTRVIIRIDTLADTRDTE
ncbi:MULTISPECIES: sensor histidine kinase [unclassified Paenibacillus]|uniref:cache domain-containing sensor histidine kinase n=1 Tax=unclassified Paenibacillus TaxID=185978 RepID=UPI002404A6B9|nr:MULTISPECIES: sensor histidine kinase [unclassified Paenibacillus]MDF9844531.1 two-component system sensor histidine kinase YesM [Paenibacillus sp. PastF-2]MDF9851135.1 two-component system sensor histidine kinase YesM [Paenibacillus sp. PastM-2]MDF9857707.1 two-component system sensor histidine kinase YesM [Paenibacillus sp. PastF-1]MDH6482973.1 two-component system sensor histidine kinase YesM [Paenibacillus sp. PastH-2]MDH6510398.1 two-component system sensor histidine kinase YesM [Paeni